MMQGSDIFSKQPTAVAPAPDFLHTTSKRLTAYFFLALSMSLVGSYVALSKPLVAALPVFLLVWLRFGIGGLAMLHWLKKPADEAPMTLATKKLVFLGSLLGNFLFSILMLYGVSMTSAVSAGVIMASIPAVVALLSWFFLRERIDLRVWAAIACAAFGIGLFALSKSELSMQVGQGLDANLSQKNRHLSPQNKCVRGEHSWYSEGLMQCEFGLHDLDFDESLVTCYSTRGTPYLKRVKVGMPRISEDVLESTFFLYSSEQEAKVGSKDGGTGFVISFPSERVPDITYFYGVTNWHAAVSRGFSVVRLNASNGSNDVISFGPEDWIFDPNGDDLAVIDLSPDFKTHQCKPIPAGLIYSRDVLHDPNGLDVGLGDDAFMIGRFVDMDGVDRNLSTARFGSISASLVPLPARGPSKTTSEGYCLDMRSKSGYSGSPVFAYRTPGTNLKLTLNRGGVPDLTRSMLCLLGVHLGQFEENLKLDRDNKKIVSGASGMTTVIPAWKILELLDNPKLKSERERSDAIWQERIYPRMVLEAAQTNSSHKEDFNGLLDAAVRGTP